MTLLTSNNRGSTTALVAGVSNPEGVASDKIGEYDNSLTETLSVSVSSGNATISSTNYPAYAGFLITGNTTGGRSVTLQAVKKFAIIDNSDAGNTQSIAIKLGSTTLNLAVGKIGLYRTDGTTNGLKLIFSSDVSAAGGALLAANNLSDLANAGTSRTNLGLGTIATKAATSGSGVQKGDGSGGLTAATSGTDYLAPPSGTSILKANSGGALSNATAGTDYGRASVDQNSQSAAYTTVLSDAGKHIYHPSGDNNARTFTIDSNANVAYPIGTAITFINEINTVTISITSDTLVLAGTGSTGSRTLAANGVATAIKVGTTRWYISGSGLT